MTKTTKTTKQTATTISARTFQGRQSWNHELITEEAGHKLRYTVKVDSYDFQSYATVEVYRAADLTWQDLHKIPGPQLASKISYVAPTCSPTVFAADLAELRRVALAILA